MPGRKKRDEKKKGIVNVLNKEIIQRTNDRQRGLIFYLGYSSL